MRPDTYFKGKRVLVMGLGLLGGGVETTRWLLKHGARVTVTDLRDKKTLEPSIKALGKGRKITWVLGRHRDADFRAADIVVVNPGVSKNSRYLKIAQRAGAILENEASLFFRFCKNPVIGITGTRGKTTTAIWTHHFLKKKYPQAVLTGNVAQDSLLKVLDRLDGESPVVAEFSSFQLEFLPSVKKSPQIAVWTNLMRDHLNRYPTMRVYAREKENIFRYQRRDNVLIVSASVLGSIHVRTRGRKILYDKMRLPVSVPKNFAGKWGLHNIANLKAALWAAHEAGVPWKTLKDAIPSLPFLKFRQEIILRRRGLEVINDTTATTPDGTIAALKKFRTRRRVPIILIAGGTDKELDYAEWARVVTRAVRPLNLILLEGSATQKMIEALPRKFFPVMLLPSLEECVKEARDRAGQLKSARILFSPGAASFEEFKNEFDRGEKFNVLARRYFGRR
jgi:UDP-N-acetylmuramoylalanine--D-glutamate ligase